MAESLQGKGCASYNDGPLLYTANILAPDKIYVTVVSSKAAQKGADGMQRGP
jgi:hypothetical protein